MILFSAGVFVMIAAVMRASVIPVLGKSLQESRSFVSYSLAMIRHKAYASVWTFNNPLIY